MANGAFEKAVRKLGGREHSKMEIVRYLHEKGFDKDEIDDTLKRLVACGYLDDARFAQRLVESCGKRYGIRQIEYRLKQAGVDSQIINSALGEYSDFDGALKVAEKYLATRSNVSKQRLCAYLYAKGFSGDAVSMAAQRLCEE